MRRQFVLDDRGNHRVVLLGWPLPGLGLYSSLHLAGLKDTDGLGELPGTDVECPGAAVEGLERPRPFERRGGSPGSAVPRAH